MAGVSRLFQVRVNRFARRARFARSRAPLAQRVIYNKKYGRNVLSFVVACVPRLFYVRVNRFARRSSRSTKSEKRRCISEFVEPWACVFYPIFDRKSAHFGPQNALKSVPEPPSEPLPYGFYLGAAKRPLILGFYADLC